MERYRIITGSACLALALTVRIAVSAPAETRAQVLAKVEQVADWQLDHLGAGDSSAPAPRAAPRGWVYAMFFVGLTALADRAGDSLYADAIFALGRRERWQLESRPFHADDYLIGQSWIWAYERSGDPIAIAAVRNRLDAIVAHPPTSSLDYGSNPPPDMESACQVRWCWADALFMGPPTFAALTHATGDPRYLVYADAEFWATVRYLEDPKEGLLVRDSRFFSRRGPHGEKIFWSRGNGWALAGTVNVLRALPRNDPSRQTYLRIFSDISERIAGLQQSDGLWKAGLLDQSSYNSSEISGSAFFTYALAWGINERLLDRSKYGPVVERSWRAMLQHIYADGRLGSIQPIGAAPDAFSPSSSYVYGVGAFLLAGSELDRYAAQGIPSYRVKLR